MVDFSRSSSRSMSILVILNGWHNGIKSAVLLAAMIPAIRATAKTSPFLFVPDMTKLSVSGFMEILPVAIAVLLVGVLSPTSTIFALPSSSR